MFKTTLLEESGLQGYFVNLKEYKKSIMKRGFIRTVTKAGLIIISAVVLVSCGGKQKGKDKRTVFRYNEMAGLTSLDPAAARNFENIWPGKQLFNGVVQMNESLRVLTSISKKWTISEDGRVYTFTIRNDVFFHDHEVFTGGKGRKVTAKDFVYSFNRLYDS